MSIAGGRAEGTTQGPTKPANSSAAATTCWSLNPKTPSSLRQQSLQEGLAAQDRSFNVFADDHFKGEHPGKRSQKGADGVPVDDSRTELDLIIVGPVHVIKVEVLDIRTQNAEEVIHPAIKLRMSEVERNAESRVVNLIDPFFEVPDGFVDAVLDMRGIFQPESDVVALGKERGLTERLFELLDRGLLQRGRGVPRVEEMTIVGHDVGAGSGMHDHHLTANPAAQTDGLLQLIHAFIQMPHIQISQIIAGHAEMNR